MKKYILLIITVLLCGLVYAEPSFYYQKGTLIDLKVPCVKDGLVCSSSSTCNITITYPNSTNLVNNQPMTYNAAYFNYTIQSLNVTGEYNSIMYCKDGTDYGYSLFSFMINNLGQKPQASYFEVILSFFTIGLTVLFFVWAYNLDGKNKFNFGEDGSPVLVIEYGKYTKLLLFFFSYIMLWISTGLVYLISFNNTAPDSIVSIFYWIFTTTTYLIAPMVIVVSMIAIISKIADDRLYKRSQQGYFNQ